MATQTIRRSTPRPPQSALTPAAKQGPPAAQSRTGTSLLVPPAAAGNQAAYRTLAQSQGKPKEASSAPGSAAPATLAGGGRPSTKLPPLDPKLRAQMLEDVERIATIMKFWIVESGDQITVTGLIEKYATLDQNVHAAPNESATPNLDHFLILLKSRSFSRSSVKSLFQDQWAILYDALWYRLRGYYLEKFKGLVNRSQTQKTSGPGDKDVESGVALIAKQEAMGMWGMLKGMGTGLVGIAGPAVAQEMAESFDETAHILFGNEWDSSEPLVWGMNAGQIGTTGGDVIWQLVTFARGAGASKAGKVWALIDKLKKVMAVGAGLQGVYLGGAGIARVIEERQKTNQPITAEALLNDPNFLDQLIVLTTSAIGAVMAAKGTPGSKTEAITRARLQFLMNQLHVASSIARFSEIAASNRSPEEKEREYGAVVANLIPQLVSAAFDAHSYAQAKGMPEPPAAAAPAKKDVPTKEGAPAPAHVGGEPEIEPTPTPKAKPQPHSGGEELGELSRKTMNEPAAPSKKTPKYHPESEAGQRLQAKLREEADTALSPREAPETPAEVKSGARKSRYTPAEEVSTTIGQPVHTLEEARARYDDVIAETSGKYEVGIYQKPDGTFAVRLGQPADVDAPPGWRSVQHYHTNEPDIPLWRMPARADITEPYLRADRTNKPATELVEYPLPGGKRGRAAYTVHPDGSLKIEFVDAAGKKAEKTFASVKDYNKYYESQTVYVDPASETYKRMIAGPKKPGGDSEPGTSTKTMYGPPATGTKAPPQNLSTELETQKAPAPKKPAATAPEGPVMERIADVIAPEDFNVTAIDPFSLPTPPPAKKTISGKKAAATETAKPTEQRPINEAKSTTKPMGDPFKELGKELRAEQTDVPLKSNAGDPLVAVRVAGDTKKKGQYWAETTDEFDAAQQGKGKKKTVRPQFLVMPQSQADALGFRPAGTPSEPTIVPRTRGTTQLESSGAGRTIGHDITARSSKKATQKKNTSSFARTVGADVAQAHGYNELLNRGERGILRPGNISRGGVDAITAEVSGGKARIYLNDFTDVDTSKPSKETHANWHKELQDAVAGKRLDLSDKTAEAAIRKAIEDGEVYVRTVRVDSSPKGNREVKLGTPQKVEVNE